MTWLSRLSFAQAVRWALVWPALVLAAVAVMGVFAAVAQARGNWGVALGVQTVGPLPVWLGVAIAVSVVVLGPSAIFLVLWRLVRR